MDGHELMVLANVLEATTPYGILVVLGFWYHRLTYRKDQEIKELNLKMLDIAERQISAIAKVESALMALKKAIEDLSRNGRGANF